MDDLTVEDLKRQLEGWPNEMRLRFQGGMTFYRLKQRDKNLVQLEFNEPQAELTKSFRRQHPDVFVAFFRSEDTGEPFQEVGVPSL